MKQITINKSWHDKLVELVDELANETDLNDECSACREKHGWISHLLGYVHSLDEHFKEEE